MSEPAAGTGGAKARPRWCLWLSSHQRAVRFWPLVAALLTVWLVTGLLAARSMEHQDAWTYSRDDAYIQMAVAKNLVEHGSWGINKGEYDAVSSSPLWASLLAGTYLVFGVNDFSPMVLNIIFVSLAIAAAFFIMESRGLSPPFNFLALLALVLFAPVPALVPLGMEHSLQILLAILFVYLAGRELAEGTRGRLGAPGRWMMVITPILVLCRYESLFMVAAVSLFLLVKKRWPAALSLAALGALPVLAVGLVSIADGGQLLPNPMTLKSRIPLFPLSNWLWTNITHIHDPFLAMIRDPVWLVLAPASVVVVLLSFSRTDPFGNNRAMSRWMNLIFLFTLYIHLQTNSSQHFRYDAYLVCLGIIAVSLPVFSYLSAMPWRASAIRRPIIAAVATVLLLAALVPLAHRGWVKMKAAPLETRRIFEQQYQMAKFLDRYYRDRVVAANDIGAINYYADIDTVDLWGLGDNEVARRRIDIRKEDYQIESGSDTKKDTFVLRREDIEGITRERGTDIALVYDDIYKVDGESRLPDDWILVGRWLCYRYERDYWDKVSFYAVDTDRAGELAQSLRRFSPDLPANVREEGPYTEQGS